MEEDPTSAPSPVGSAVAADPPAGSVVADYPDYIPPAAFTASTATTPTKATPPSTVDSTEQLLSSFSATPEEFTRRIATFSDARLKTLLEGAGMKPFATRQKNIYLMKQWIGESPQRRPYFHQTKPNLIALCVARFGGASRHFHGQIDSRGPSSTRQPLQGRGNSDATGESVRTLLLKKIVEASFMPRLTSKGKEYCKTGHQLEIPLGKNFCNILRRTLPFL